MEFIIKNAFSQTSIAHAGEGAGGGAESYYELRGICGILITRSSQMGFVFLNKALWSPYMVGLVLGLGGAGIGFQFRATFSTFFHQQ